ncbi:MAG: sulfurtransferase TusA family protein [Myxococcota bacterium]
MNAEPVQFDWRGLSCPEPIIHMARAARDLHSSGGVLHVLADDAAFPADLESWCRSSGAELLNIRRTSGAFRAEVRVSSQNRQGPVAEAQHSSSPTAAKDLVLDCRGQSCPEPILKLARFVRELPPTTVQFEVLATDPAFPADVESWCRSAGVTLHTLEELPQHIRAVIHLSERTTVQPTKLKATSKPPAAPSRRPSSEAATAGAHEPGEAVNTIHFDLCGLDKVQRQARLDALSHMAFEGTLITLLADSAEFGVELTAWCATYGHALRHFEVRDGHHHATIVPTSNPHSTLPVPLSEAQKHKRCTILVLHNDFEALVAALMIANGAASMGMDTTMFFTFWGLNLLRGQTRR